jgi:hypothetical protein
MPFVDDEPGPPESLPPTPRPGPSLTDVAGAALRDSNSVVSVYRGLANSGPYAPTPGYSARDLLMSRPDLWEHSFRLAGAQSEAQANAIVAEIDQQNADKATLSAAGPMGFVVGAGLGLFDPTNLLPGRVAVRAWQEGRGALKGAIEMGTAMAVQGTAQEAALQASQEGRPLSESALNVGSGTLVGALLGGAAGWLHPGELEAIASKMTREREVNDAHVMGQPAPAAAGAAETDTRDREYLTPVPTGIGAEKLKDNIVTRTLMQKSLTAQRVATDLAEVAVLVKGNLEGKTTTLDGRAPLETMSRVQRGTWQTRVDDLIEEGWKATNFEGGKAPWLAKLRDQMGRFGGLAPDRVTYEEFDRQVGRAAMYGDKSDNPHVQRAAEELRKLYDHYSGRAEKSVPGFQRAEQYEGESFFTHRWNTTLITARRPQFVDELAAKFKGDQQANQGVQTALKAYQGALESHEGSIKKYTTQLERLQEDLKLDEAKAEEVRRQNKFGYQTAERMRESSYENVGGIREAAPEKNIEKARGGALFETQIRARGNKLAEDALKHRNKVADLEEKLQAEHASAAEVRRKIEEEIGKWHGQSPAEAKSAIKAREKAEAEREAKRAEGEPKGGRLTSADEAVDKAVKRILESPQELMDEELRNEAQQTTNRIIGSPEGRLPYDETSASPYVGPDVSKPALRGSLAERPLDVSNAFAEKWIEQSASKAAETYLRTFVPDVLLAERFGGDIELNGVMRGIQDDYAAAIDQATSEAERTRLGKQLNDTMEDVGILRDRLRGIYGIPSNASQRRIGRIAAAVRNFNVFTSMGLAAASSIPDTAVVTARWGLNHVFNDAWAPYLKSLMTDRKLTTEAKRQFKLMDIATETIRGSRSHELSGASDPYAKLSKFERLLQAGADKFNLLNLMAHQTDMNKIVAATVASNGIYRAVKRAAEGKATKTDLLQVGQANIPQRMWDKIVEEYEASGDRINGEILPNTEKWENQEARDIFEAALNREVNISVVTPGIDKPAFISEPVLGVLTQFKSFTAAATTRIMVANLQRADGQTLQGVMTMFGFGAMAYAVHSIASGQPMSSNPSDWAKEAVSRSSFLGWLDEANTLVSKGSRNQIDMYRLLGAQPGLKRDMGRGVLEQLLGPTVGKLENLTKVTGAAATGDFSAGDIHAARRWVPGQNYLFFNRVLDEVEKSLNSSLGIPQQQHRQ